MDIEKNKATLILPEKEINLTVLTDNMGDRSIDITSLRKETGYITYDPATGAVDVKLT